MKELEQYFKALGDTNRLRILNLLLHGELCVCDIQYVLEATQPNVSRHLSYLKNSGLVLDRRDGYRIYYRLPDPKQGTKKRLFEFLQGAYKNEERLQADKKRLREAIQAGSCTLGEWKPYSAVGGTKGAQANRT
jgi:ArsR family transcriptional regulator, arsenate/arsenite/antimonite-responsive transcriptional repressor